MTDKCLGFFLLNSIPDLFSEIWMVGLALLPHSKKARGSNPESLCVIYMVSLSLHGNYVNWRF